MMGSIGDHPKGDTPFLELIKKHNAHHAAAIRRCAEAAPLWRKLFAKLGFKNQLYNWQARNQHRFWEEK